MSTSELWGGSVIKGQPCSPPWPGFGVQPEAILHATGHSPGSSWHLRMWHLHWMEQVALKMNDYTFYYVYTSGEYGTFENSFIFALSAGFVEWMVTVISAIKDTLDHNVSMCVLPGLSFSHLWNAISHHLSTVPFHRICFIFSVSVFHRPFYQVCIRYHLCGVETARYPTMHCTSASSSNGGKYVLQNRHIHKFTRSCLPTVN